MHVKKISFLAVVIASAVILVACSNQKGPRTSLTTNSETRNVNDDLKDIGYPKNFFGTYKSEDGKTLTIKDNGREAYGIYEESISEDISSGEDVDTAHSTSKIEGDFGAVKHIKDNLYQLDYSTAIGLAGLSLDLLPSDFRVKAHDALLNGKKGLADLLLVGFKYDEKAGTYQAVVYAKDDAGNVDYTKPALEGQVFRKVSA